MESIVQGIVVHGEHEGQKLGFPTANLSTPESNIEPACGIYAGTVTITGDNETYSCAVVIRLRSGKKALEVHILDFNDNLYEKELTVTTKDLIRNWEDFSDIHVLKKQIGEDLEQIRKLSVKD